MAYRIAAHGLHRTETDLARLAVLGLGVQDAQQVAARLAIAARLDADPATLDKDSFPGTLHAADVTLAWTHRGAPHLHHAADLPELASMMVPLDDADAQARLSWQRKDVSMAGMPPTEALSTAAAALRDVVDETMTKGAASERVSKVLPDGLVRWCRGCQSTHIHEQLMRLTTLPGGIRLEPDVSPATLTPLPGADLVTAPDPAALTRVVERYLHLHGPATQADVAGFIGTTKSVVAGLWPRDLTEVDFAGRTTHLSLPDLDALADPPEPDLVRLLPPSDPLLQSRDRDTLVPERADQKAVWRILGNPGAVLADGQIVGTWRAKAAGKKRLDLTVIALGALGADVQRRLQPEAARVAAARGYPDFTLGFP